MRLILEKFWTKRLAKSYCTGEGVFKRTLVGVLKRTQLGIYKLLNSISGFLLFWDPFKVQWGLEKTVDF